MKTLVFLLVLLTQCEPQKPIEVYICNSKSAGKYHYSTTCRGLSKCNHQVIKVTLEDAKSSGKGLCSWEKKQKNNLNGSN